LTGLDVRFAIASLILFCGAAEAGEPNASDEHLGRYETVVIDDDPEHRAAGHGGSGKKVRASIEIARAGDALTARYAVSAVDAPGSETTATLSEVTVRDDRFSAAPIAVKTAWPLYLPNSFEGRFDGPDVLVIDGQRYRRAGRTRMVAAFILAAQQVAHPEPRLPAAFKAVHARQTLKAMYKVCVGTDGGVSEVTTMAPLPDEAVDKDVRRQIREGWRYKPQAEPVCTASVVVFKID
jgi:hypothetical protein